MPALKKTDVVIIGASASGLMCAIEAGKRGRKVIVLDHANKAGKKILMSGGGRCNFTNMDVDSSNFISNNPHFCKSALSRFNQWDFIAMVNRHNISYHERDLGKLFCDDSAKDILNMLLKECEKASISIQLNCTIEEVSTIDNDPANLFNINTQDCHYQSTSLVVACGGLSIPKMCASPLGYQLAEQFDHKVIPTTAGLVPFTLQPEDKNKLEELAGITVETNVSNQRINFNNENILFTHRGLSGPAILQVSSYWRPGEALAINLLPNTDLAQFVKLRQKEQPNLKLKTILTEILPKRIIPAVFKTSTFTNSATQENIIDKRLQELSQSRIDEIVKHCHQWQIKPNGTEGYRTAEVTLGGVDCNELSSKTMQSNKVSGLYFIGEVVDVTGWLGGYNFQWAWSSGWCAGQVA